MAAKPYHKPLLGPLFAWARFLSASSCVHVPAFILTVLHLLLARFRSKRMIPCLRISLDVAEVELFRVDMKAEAEIVRIAGWETAVTTNPGEARWFRVTFDRKAAPWMFRRGEPFRLSQSLELLAALIALMIFVPAGRLPQARHRRGRIRMRVFGCRQRKLTRSYAASVI